MTSTSLKNRILSWVQRSTEHDPNSWIHVGDIERNSMQAGYSASNGARRCRELYAEGYLDRRERSDGTVEYRYSENYRRMKTVGLV